MSWLWSYKPAADKQIDGFSTSSDHCLSDGGNKIYMYMKQYTVECRYNTVQYDTILHTSLQLPRQNINQSVNPQRHPMAMGSLL